MGMTAEQYREQLLAASPRGDAWPRDPDSVFAETLHGLAIELARIDARGDDLIEEADPRTTLELLTDWERAFGLPEKCLALPDTLEERRLVLHEKVTRIGGQSPGYYIAVAARLGFVITITEFRPYTVADTVDTPIYGIDWIFAWRVNAPAETVRYFTVPSGVNEPLADWGNEILECVISRLKPAHTHVQFAYGG